MAKIEMDISEYEIMQENKRLLKDSLDKERELQKQIEQLNKEKIEALENAKMKVVKISKTQRTEFALVKNPNYWQNILSHVRIYGARFPDWEQIETMFFQKTTSESFPTEEITTHGLDEIKVEIRQDIESKITEDIKEKLDNAAILVKTNEELVKENKALSKENKLLLPANNELLEKVKSLEETAKELNNEIKSLTAFKENIKRYLKDGYSFWNYNVILNQIKELIK